MPSLLVHNIIDKGQSVGLVVECIWILVEMLVEAIEVGIPTARKVH